MQTQRRWKFLTLALLATSLLAQTNLQGPVSGYVFDAAEGAIRPLMGVPGASYLGEPVVASLDFASIAPSGNLALCGRGGRLFLVRGFESGNTRWLELENDTSVDRMSWAADSDSVALYSAATDRLRMWSGLGSWQIGSSGRLGHRRPSSGILRPASSGLRLTSFGNLRELGGVVSAIAVTDYLDVVVGVEDPVRGGLYLGSERPTAKADRESSRPGKHRPGG